MKLKKSYIIISCIFTICFIILPYEQSYAESKLKYYQNVFDNEINNNRAILNNIVEGSMIFDGSTGINYYYCQYILDATLSMFEACGDNKYLEMALSWAETMISNATIIDCYGNKNWPGEWVSPYADQPIIYQLYEFQASTELARLAAIIKNDKRLNIIYGDRAIQIYMFVKEEIINKWFYKRQNLAGMYNAIFNIEIKDNILFNDRYALLIRTLIYLIKNEEDYRYRLVVFDFGNALKSRFQPYNNGLIWDLGRTWTSDPNSGFMDTGHANRYPYSIIEYYKAGIIFTRYHINGLADLLCNVIWDKSLDSPQFTNFLDGTNYPALGRGPWGCSVIYCGWIALGEFDERIQEIGDAVLTAILAGRHNPSLDYMNTFFGRMELSGHLAKNQTILYHRGNISGIIINLLIDAD